MSTLDIKPAFGEVYVACYHARGQYRFYSGDLIAVRVVGLTKKQAIVEEIPTGYSCTENFDGTSYEFSPSGIWLENNPLPEHPVTTTGKYKRLAIRELQGRNMCKVSASCEKDVVLKNSNQTFYRCDFPKRHRIYDTHYFS